MLSVGFADVKACARELLKENVDDDCGFEIEPVVVVESCGLASVALEANDANEKFGAGAVLVSSDVVRLSEKPLDGCFAESPRLREKPEPNPGKLEEAGLLPNPPKIGAVVVATVGAFAVLLSAVLDAESKGLEVTPVANEKPLVPPSPAPDSSDEKFGVLGGALMFTVGDSSFFSPSLNVNVVFSVVDGGLFSS